VFKRITFLGDLVFDRGKEFGMISTANGSEGSDMGQSLDIVAEMMISDIVVEIIIFRV
jgi:hypothetical protein